MNPTGILVLIGQLALAATAVGDTSSAPTTTVCATSTVWTTLTVTVSGHSTVSSTGAVASTFSSPIASVAPVEPSSVPSVSPGSSLPSTHLTVVPPFPTHNATTLIAPTVPVTGTHIVSHPSGSATASSSAPLEQPTNASGKINTNGLAVALVAVGAAFFSL